MDRIELCYSNWPPPHVAFKPAFELMPLPPAYPSVIAAVVITTLVCICVAGWLPRAHYTSVDSRQPHGASSPRDATLISLPEELRCLSAGMIPSSAGRVTFTLCRNDTLVCGKSRLVSLRE